MKKLIVKKRKVISLLLCLALCLNLALPAMAAEEGAETDQPETDLPETESSSTEDISTTDMGGFELRVRSTEWNAVMNNANPNKYDKVVQDRINEVAKNNNFKLIVTDSLNSNPDYMDYNDIIKAIQSGSSTIGHFIETTLPLGLAGYAQGYFQDLNQIDESTGFVVSDESRFWQDMTKAATFEGGQFGVALITGSVNFTPPANGVFWFFNKNVVTEGGYSPATIYKLVRDYQWTLDEATKIMEACYVPDANGDGAPEVYGLCSYKRQNKYYIQLDGGQTVRKVNGKYTFTATDANVMSVLNWLQDVYVTKKLGATLGSSDIRNFVRDGKTVFTQGAPDYLTRVEFTGTNLDAYQANVGIVPSPVGNNQIKNKVYINPTPSARIYVMPSTVKGTEQIKAATAFAALCEAVNSKADNVEMMKDIGALYDADTIDMYENYITKNCVADLGYVTETVGISSDDPIMNMVLSVTSGKQEPEDAIDTYTNDVIGIVTGCLNNSDLDEETGVWATGTCGAADNGDNLIWELNFNGKLTISGTSDMADYSGAVLPPWIGYGRWIRSVVVEEGVTSIGDYAFNEFGLSVGLPSGGFTGYLGATYGAIESVEIPSTVKRIGDNAFNGCSTLKTVYYAGSADEWSAISIGSNNQSLINANIIMRNGILASGTCGAAGNEPNVVWELADGVLTISGSGKMADYTADNQPWSDYYDIHKFVISEGVTNIGSYAISRFKELEEIEISSTVATINPSAFSHCSLIESITVNPDNPIFHLDGNCVIETATNKLVLGSNNSVIPEYVTCIGEAAFMGRLFKAITIPGNVTEIQDQAFWDCDFLEEITIPEGVRTLGFGAFLGCDYLRKVTIPSSVTSIGEIAFNGCRNLTDISISANVTFIGSGAFSGIGSEVVVDGDNAFYHVDGSCLIETATNTLISGYANSVIPDYVTSIGTSAFSKTFGLTNIAVPASVMHIGGQAFYLCTSLTSITIPEGVTGIDVQTFGNCSSLTSVTIPSSVEEIGYRVFENCVNLNDIYYAGTEADWANITVGEYNDPLLNATVHYNYVADEEIPEEPVENIGSIDAEITAPEGGWKVGENTFKVEAEKACYVAVSYDGGKTFVRVPAIPDPNGGYRFTADNMDANTIISVGAVGDVDGDGVTRARDARLALQAASGLQTLSGCGQLAADLDGDGVIRAREARQMLQAASDMYTLGW